MIHSPKKYFDNNRLLIEGNNLSNEQKESLSKGEVFTLVSIDREPLKKILMDSYNQIREGGII